MLHGHTSLTSSSQAAPTPSFQPIGINAAATSSTPLSVANRLNWLAAFLVSSTSTLMPKLAICFLVAGLSGLFSGPKPRINRSVRHTVSTTLFRSSLTPPRHADQHLASPSHSPPLLPYASPNPLRTQHLPGLGQTAPNTPNAPSGSGTSHCPLALINFFPCSSQGRQTNASPPTNNAPDPPPISTDPSPRLKPSGAHASTEVAGAGVLARTSMVEKSVGGGWSGTASLLGPPRTTRWEGDVWKALRWTAARGRERTGRGEGAQRRQRPRTARVAIRALRRRIRGGMVLNSPSIKQTDYSHSESGRLRVCLRLRCGT